MYNDENNQYNPRPRFDPRQENEFITTMKIQRKQHRQKVQNTDTAQEIFRLNRKTITLLLSAEQYIPAGYNLSAGRRRARAV